MALSDKLNKTKFLFELMVKSQPIISKHIKAFAETHEDFMSIGTTSEKYAKKALYSFIDLQSSVDGLELVPIFFSINKVPAFYLKNDISEIQYYKYHLENHYIKITSIIDYVSNFINYIYRLGIPSRKCNAYAIIENLNTRHTDTANILKEFESHFQNLKRKRNIIIHEGKFESEEIKSIDSTIVDKGFLKEEKILIDWFNSRKKVEINKVLEKIDRDNSDVIRFLIDISETLKEPFINNYRYLSLLEETK